MDIMFSEIPSGRNFIIEIGYFDTVHEIKEKIEKLQGIPISNQTLVFKNQVMVNDRDTEFYEILHGSQILLQIKSDTPTPPTTKSIVKMEESSSSTSASTLQLIVKFPSVKKQFSIDMEPTDSVMKMKEKIQGVERIPLNPFSLIFNNNELNENRSLEDYPVSNLSEIIVVYKPFPSAMSPSSNGNSSKRLKLMVLPKGGAQKIQVEVNACDNVGELRKELQKLQQQINICLPSEAYFFIYKQNVMDDDRSFRWHDVKQGDTIEIFNGSVTGGS